MVDFVFACIVPVLFLGFIGIFVGWISDRRESTVTIDKVKINSDGDAQQVAKRTSELLAEMTKCD